LEPTESTRTAVAAVPPPPAVVAPVDVAGCLAWMRPDLLVRLLPFSAAVAAAWLVARPAWLGLGPGDPPVQLAFGLAGAPLVFAAACLLQRGLARRRQPRVPVSAAAVTLQAGYFLLNAPVEEAFFRGLLQGCIGALVAPGLGLAAGTVSYVLYHRLGGWSWTDVLLTALVGVPLAVAFWALPGPPSLLGVSLVHFGATCGFLGPGAWLLHRLGLVEPRP
jgi:hypothetical protein